jgi:hypothetical protein
VGLHRRSTCRTAVARAAAQQQQSLSSLQPADGSRVAQLKAEIARQAGSKNGTDLTAEQHASIKDVISELEDLSPTQQPASVDLAGTNWKLVYTTSTAASSGKIGPFVGLVEQEFPASQPAQYINWVTFAGGLVKARLLADYKAAPDRDNKLNVQFLDTTFMLGPLKYTQQFDANRGGWWRLTYVDNDYRILYANTENVFILAR